MSKTKDSKEPDFTQDEYWGKGGSYWVNPATGKREPAPVVEDAAAGASVPAQVGQRPDDAAPGVQTDAQGLGQLADFGKKSRR